MVVAMIGLGRPALVFRISLKESFYWIGPQNPGFFSSPSKIPSEKTSSRTETSSVFSIQEGLPQFCTIFFGGTFQVFLVWEVFGIVLGILDFLMDFM